MKKNYFGTILTEELAQKPLRVSERLVLGYIKSFSSYCPHHNAVIAERLGLSKRTVAYAIANLKKYGLIKVEKQNNNNYKRHISEISQGKHKREFSTAQKQRNNRGELTSKAPTLKKFDSNFTGVLVENKKDSAKIALPWCKNCTKQNREDGAKIALHKNKNKKKNKNRFKGRPVSLAEICKSYYNDNPALAPKLAALSLRR